MSRRKQLMQEDKELRNTARSLMQADVAHVKNIFSGPSLGKRVAGRIGDGASDVLETAGQKANSHRGILAALVSAVVLWFAREPLLALFDDAADTEDATEDGELSLTEPPLASVEETELAPPE